MNDLEDDPHLLKLKNTKSETEFILGLNCCEGKNLN